MDFANLCYLYTFLLCPFFLSREHVNAEIFRAAPDRYFRSISDTMADKRFASSTIIEFIISSTSYERNDISNKPLEGKCDAYKINTNINCAADDEKIHKSKGTSRTEI